MNIYLSENIKRLRRENELTQETLAEFLGVTFQSVSKWERGESYPDITMLPAIASFFDTTVDNLLGVDKAQQEKKIREYLEFHDKMRLKDTPLTLSKFETAVKEFPGEFRILVRYMELLMAEKTDRNSPHYEKTSQEIMTIYENIQNHCTDDSIRMWSKRLICQHLHTKAHYTDDEKYQQQCEKILSEMPDMINSKEYLSTMLIADKDKHYKACADAIEQLLMLTDYSMSHYCFYDDRFSDEYKIEAITKMVRILEIIYTDGNFGKCWLPVIYNYGNLGQLYHQTGDNKKAVENLWKSAKLAKEYDSMPEITQMKAQFFESSTFEKTLRGKTMCERMLHHFTKNYPLSETFRESEEFKEILAFLE